VRDHSYARYSLGPNADGVEGKGCRCEICRGAAREYRKKDQIREVPAYVTATAAREHVAWLSTQGVGLKQVAKISGVSQGAMWKLVYGKRQPDGSQIPSKRIRPATAEKILAVTPSDGADGSLVPAGPVWADVRRLLSRGWTKRAIARGIGQDGCGLQLGEDWVQRRNVAAVHALLDLPVPDDVGAAWSARHKATVEADPEPVKGYDDRDQFILEMAVLLEQRADQSDWRKRRACRGKPPWMFFPQRGDVETLEAAKAVCSTCPVAEQCLEANLDQREGIFGGLSDRQRRVLRRERELEETPAA